jgi:hypothetical protein
MPVVTPFWSKSTDTVNGVACRAAKIHHQVEVERFATAWAARRSAPPGGHEIDDFAGGGGANEVVLIFAVLNNDDNDFAGANVSNGRRT